MVLYLRTCFCSLFYLLFVCLLSIWPSLFLLLGQGRLLNYDDLWSGYTLKPSQNFSNFYFLKIFSKTFQCVIHFTSTIESTFKKDFLKFFYTENFPKTFTKICLRISLSVFPENFSTTFP